MFRPVVSTLLLAAAATLAVACGSTTTSNSSGESVTPFSLGNAQVRQAEFLSEVYHIDKKYMSMQGPYSIDKVRLRDGQDAELLWIVGYDAEVVSEDGQTMSQEFMCHANLDIDPYSYFEDFQSNASLSGRLFTLSQGMQDVRFPDGFGIPLMSDTPLDVFTQVLNLNIDDPDLDVRHRVRIHYIRDAELAQPLRPLYQAGAQGMKSLEDQPADYGYESASFEGKPEKKESKHGPGCSVGAAAMENGEYIDEHGQKFTGHWIVEPGVEVNRTNVTKYLQLPYDTTVHYIAVHLHPFAEWLELRDLTTGETVFRSNVTLKQEQVGIERVEHFESVEGVKIYKDHEYEVVSRYNNTTGENVDSMAVMFLYVEDINFRHPTRGDDGKLAQN